MSEDDALEDDPLWYKEAVIYELHVKAFYDSNGDGIGDFRGLTSKLDYLKELGITAIWLLPFYPSPLKDDGYDIADYYNVHSSYGTLDDFREFLREAHFRGIRVVTELVLNHTSDQNPWFLQSRLAPPGSKMRDFYVWSDTPDKYKDARIIFKDFEVSNWTYDPVAKAYYWHRFYSYQPDLNFENPNVQKSMLEVVKYWLGMGVDGLRLDAVPYIFEREGTNCENLPETHQYLKKLRADIDAEFKNRMLLAEANQWPEDAAQYFGNGDECHMIFHFPLMPRMFMAIQMEDSFPVIEILEQTPKPPENCQYALFLRNHDELTLEMVTDEERDYMYRVYARDKQARLNLGIRRRLAPLLGDDRRKIELMNIMLFTLPGTPVIYYGDEIGMGDNFYLGDRNGVRTPMQWSADLNAGFSRTNPQKLYLPVIIEPKYHYEAVNVENQVNDTTSLMWWMKRLIDLRKRYKVFGYATVQFLFSENTKILMFLREYNDERVLIMLNLSRNSQSADFDLSKFEGFYLKDLFSGVSFPPISKTRYNITFGPYGYYIFILGKPQASQIEERPQLQEIRLKKRIQELFIGKARDKLEQTILPVYLSKCRWFGGKGRDVERLRIRDVIEIEESAERPLEGRYNFAVIDAYYSDGLPEAYLLPLGYLPIDRATGLVENKRNAVVSRVAFEKGDGGILFDAIYDPEFCRAVLERLVKKKVTKDSISRIEGVPREPLRTIAEPGWLSTTKVAELGVEQSNSSILFDEQAVMKFIRKVEEGINPEIEIADVLAKHSFTSTPQLLGELKYITPGAEAATVAIVQGYIRNQGDCWKLFLSEFQSFLGRVTSGKDYNLSDFDVSAPLLEMAFQDVPDGASQLLTPLFLEKVRLLGQRTAEFHIALFEETSNPDFRPEPLRYLSQVAISQAMIGYANRVFRSVSKSDQIQSAARQEMDGVLNNQDLVTKKFAAMRKLTIDAVLMRTHGDYHLGQVLYTGKDFAIIDYEGEPSRSLSDRRIKRSPLRDVAGMIRSFQYVAYSTLMDNPLTKGSDAEQRQQWADVWYKYTSSVFLRSYLQAVEKFPIVPKEKETLSVLFEAYLLEKVVYELWYEFNNRPMWILIPLKGIREILGPEYKVSPQTQDSLLTNKDIVRSSKTELT